MSAIYPKVHPRKIFDYFNNIVDQDKAKKLHSFSIARSICHIAVQISSHRISYMCFCFSCRIFRLLLAVLLSRAHGKLLLIIRKSNYANIMDDYVYRKIRTILRKKK